jgi:hypothetical protein
MSVIENTQTAHDQIEHLPCQVLFSLARNESGSIEFRKAAIQLMLEKGCQQVNSSELALLVSEVKRGQDAKLEVESIVESAIEQEISGPFRASVTTKTMQQPPELIRNAGKLGRDALGEDFDVDPLSRKPRA